MRKQDIKPGVVYAYREGKYRSATPIVFLSADLYVRQGRGEGRPKFRKAPAGRRAGGTYSGELCGYPVVQDTSRYRPHDQWPDWDAIAQRMAAFTLAVFEASPDGAIDDDIRFGVLGQMSYVIGTWEEAAAAQRAGDEQRRLEMEARAASQVRAKEIALSLSLHGIGVGPIPLYGAVDSVSLPLDEAEKLIALLGAGTGQEG